MLSAGVTWGVINRTDYWQWIIIILVQIPVPFAIILAAPFLVESPRWLVSKGRTEDAVNSLRRLRGNHLSDFDLREEVDVIKAGYDAQKQLHAGIGWIELFRGKNAYRTMVAVGVQCLQ
jgi:SP family general alpha glucoside:H+ symporter-like MFS transporter